MKPTIRAQATAYRTYHRIKEDGLPENWNDVVNRVIQHQRWLWERAQGKELNTAQLAELEELRNLIASRHILPAGRTLFLGGTGIAQTRESSMFNCSFLEVRSVYDVVDVLWLLLQGCGVGFAPITGTLTGFRKPIKDIEVRRSTRTDGGGHEDNIETVEDGTWHLTVGDSAKAWARAIGKLLAGKYNVDRLILDFTQIRPAGTRLKGYGWISSGDEQIAAAFTKIADILSNRSDQLLTRMDILDIINLLGTVLSSRRSAEICLFEYGKDEWREFAVAKKDFWLHGNEHRQQSNNSLVFNSKPTREQLAELFSLMIESGGSEPGFVNAESALQRAPWFKGFNPCAEILLGDKSFCNLTEINLVAFKGSTEALYRALHLAARMNYRQTCVFLKDEILQEAWHLNNDYLRLCGVGLTGIASRPDMTAYTLRRMRSTAIAGAYSMANELGAPKPKNVTTIKPSGTLSKIMGDEERGEVPEGIHTPLGKYIFNNITYSKHDPMVERFRAAGYRVMEKPFEPESVIICFPVKYDGVPFTQKKVGDRIVEVNTETAIDQLERYKLYMDHWCDQNVSITVSYDPKEKEEIIDWLLENWNTYVAVSFLFRNDPTKTAEDLGYAYLPQEVKTQEEYEEYVQRLQPVSFDDLGVIVDDNLEDECQGGACPVR
jgi:ribonucleoside-triphosphate reductase